MAKRGTKPKPTALKFLEGNPGRRKLPKREPKPDPSLPICPVWLDRVARYQWSKLAPELHGIGVLTKIDGNLLARYCQTWSRWRKMEQWIQKHGETTAIKGDNGRILGYKRNPPVDIAARLLEILTRLEPELGMTPSGRTRLEVGGEPEKPSRMKELILGPKKKSG